MMAEPLQELGDHIAQATGDAVMAAYVRLGELMLDARPENLIALLSFLRDDPRCLFKQLVDVCGVDWPEREKRFDVVYNLLSLKNNQRVRVKVATDESTPVPSASGLFNSAGWCAKRRRGVPWHWSYRGRARTRIFSSNWATVARISRRG